MIDLAKVSYRFVVMDESGKQYNIKDYVTDLGWEEPEKELSTRISFSAKNDKTSVGKLSSIIKIGCLVGIFASDGKSDDEVARGYVVDWNPKETLDSSLLTGKCYDGLFSMTESEDYLYQSSGASTKTVIKTMLDRWSVPLGTYNGPNVEHGKLVYKSQGVTDILLDVLDDARKKGGNRAFIQERKGAAHVLKYGTNSTVYHFDGKVLKSTSHKRSTDGMVTRVKIMGQADDDKKSSIEATVNGKTKFGIRQKVITRDKDESLSDAKSDAQEILDEKGDIQETIQVQGPDIPWIHKGDMVHVSIGSLSGYYVVLGISHDIDSRNMTMTLHLPYPIKDEKTKTKKKSYKVGDIVNFHGGTHYVSSYPGAKGYSVKAGKAKITKMNGSGKKHPWHLITRNWSQTHVYGWVDDGTFD